MTVDTGCLIALIAGGVIPVVALCSRGDPAERLIGLDDASLLVLLAGVLPSVGGWGPREGVTAWVFAAAGLHAQRGVTTAVVYGVMVLVASLPGAAVLMVAWFRGSAPPNRTEPLLRERPAHA